MPYIGNTAPNNFVSVVKDLFSGDGSTVAFTLSKASTTNGVAVFVENVRQEPTIAYAVSGTTLTFTGAPASSSGNNIYVMHHNAPASTVTHPAAQPLTATSGAFTAKSSVDISSSGNAIDLKLSGTTIGNVGVISDRVYLTAEGSHGVVLDASANDFFPCSTTGTDNDNNIDLGHSAARWKSVYVGTDIRIGGTGTANALDDYEEGTWTPGFSALGDSGSTITAADYTKVGRIVHLFFNITIVSTSDTSPIQISGLPFDGDGNKIQTQPNPFNNVGAGDLVPYVQGTSIFFGKSDTFADTTYANASGKFIRGNITYQVL
jgi:hypothetical protein